MVKVKIASDQDLVTSNTYEGIEHLRWRSLRQEEFAFNVNIRGTDYIPTERCGCEKGVGDTSVRPFTPEIPRYCARFGLKYHTISVICMGIKYKRSQGHYAVCDGE